MHPFIASVSIIPLERVSRRDIIDCPGDNISYRCHVLSNSEGLQLAWNVAILGETPIRIEYSSASTLNLQENFSMGIASALTGYSMDGQYIESTLTLTLSGNYSMNQTLVECFSADLDRSDVLVTTDILG